MCKINTQKSIAFLLTTNMQKAKFKTVSFITTSKEIKHLDTNLIKHVQNLYEGNYKILIKEICEKPKIAGEHTLFMN